MKINIHNHTTGSDGKLTPEELIKYAIKKKFDIIGITDHYPLPKELHEENFHPKGYAEEIKKLKQKYSNKIKVLFGAEFDWLKSHQKYTKEKIKQENYDYILGSVHFVPYKKTYLCVDYSKEEWINRAKKVGGVKKFIKKYYKQIRLLAKSHLVDCIAHFDLIKLYNENSDLFSENEKWYKKEIMKTLRTIAKEKACIELNNSGWRRKCNEQYPSKWILKEAKKLNIPITLGTDSHVEEAVDYKIEESINLLKKVGYKEIIYFEEREMFKIKI